MNIAILELNESRREDLKKLISIRNSKRYNWSQLEVRNMLFIYAICCSHLRYEEAIKELAYVKAQLPCKSENYFKAIIKNMNSYIHYFLCVDKCRYKFSNEKIIEMLNITHSEMLELDSIIDEKEEKRRQDLNIESELERLRIESEVEKSQKNYEAQKELEKEANIDQLIFNYCDPFLDSDV